MTGALRRKEAGWFAAVVLLSAAALLVCSKNSPLFPRNDWCDVNCFMTVGRAMQDGGVLYRDIYEQKGPVLYFVYYLLGFLSDRYWPVYLLECLSWGAFVHAGARFASSGGRSRLCAMAYLACLPPAMLSFAQGGSVEECFLFLIAVPLFWLMELARDGGRMPVGRAVLTGAACAVCFWVKYTMCGFFLGACLFILWYDLTQEKSSRLLWRDIGLFVAGFLAASVPVILYFAVNGAFGDLWRAYFYNNMFVYVKADSVIDGASVPMRILVNTLSALLNNMAGTWMGLIGLLFLFLDPDVGRAQRAAAVLCFACLLVTTCFIGVGYYYYGFVFTAFAPLGLQGIVKTARSRGWRVKRWQAGAVVCAGLVFSVLFSKNLYYVQYWDRPSPQGAFGAYIEKDFDGERPVVLQYMYLDMGFMLEADSKIPSPYFCWLNIDLPEIREFQTDMINNREADYVVICGYSMEDYAGKITDLDTSGYEQAMSVTGHYWYDEEIEYFLYRKVGG